MKLLHNASTSTGKKSPLFQNPFLHLRHNGSPLGVIKREPGENPGHFPMLLAPLKACSHPVLPLSQLIGAGRPRKGGVSQKTCLVLLIIAFGKKSTGEIKVGSFPVFFCICIYTRLHFMNCF
jgi:hypothetical protein